MEYYPLFLSLRGVKCLVIGAGAVGCRKVSTLLEAGATVCMLDTRIPEAIAPFTNNPGFSFENRPFQEEDLHNCRLVFAASGNAALNAHVAALCHDRGILCNIADNPTESDFFVPSHICRGSLTLALSTSGKSPAFTRAFKKELETWLDANYTNKEILLDFLGALREPVLALGETSEENGMFFRLLAKGALADTLADALAEKNLGICKAVLAEACAISYNKEREVWARLAPKLVDALFLSLPV